MTNSEKIYGSELTRKQVINNDHTYLVEMKKLQDLGWVFDDEIEEGTDELYYVALQVDDCQATYFLEKKDNPSLFSDRRDTGDYEQTIQDIIDLQKTGEFADIR